jgi:uncharacterized protein YcgI (DUF1989 family)
MTALQEIPARRGKAARLAKGQTLRVVNTHGTQVIDTWAFNTDDLAEFMSMEHCHTAWRRTMPKVGEAFVTNRRRPILTLVEDTSPGIHDTLISACDKYRYETLGHKGYHESCTENLHLALAELGLKPPEVPCPLNMWMNIPVGPGGVISFEPTVSKPGDHVLLKAELNTVVVFSACPMDLNVINGGKTLNAHFQIA